MEVRLQLVLTLVIFVTVTHITSSSCDHRINDVDPTSPQCIARRVADRILAYRDIFFVWEYGGALIFDGLYQINKSLGIDYETTLNMYLNRFMTDPERYGYKILHGIDIPYDDAIGDDLGLFPIAYLNRMDSCMTDNCSTESDKHIVEFVVQYVINWPKHLADDTISRDVGWHSNKGHHANFVWADDQYMGLTLLARWARLTRNITIAQFITKQAILLAHHLRDPNDNLYFHGYDDERKMTSCCKWGRGNGWGMMAHVEILIMLEVFPSLQDQRVDLLKILSTHSEALLKYQSRDGRFHQVINESLTYLETSSTAMVLTSLVRAVRHGWLNKKMYDDSIRRAWTALTSVVQPDGTVDGICMPTGVQCSVWDYQKRPCVYLLSGDGGLGAVLQATVQMYYYAKNE